MVTRGAYPAARAAALSGVPKSTVHHWAREEILVPSVSASRVKLWSYADLMGLRTISWLRRTKESPDGVEVPRSSMPAVRRALEALRDLDSDLWTEEEGPAVAVDRVGEVVVNPAALPERPNHQTLINAQILSLLRPFPAAAGEGGPDLHKPRPSLRIVPGKLSGSPHVARSRIETQALAALARRGMMPRKIIDLYPFLSEVAVTEAINLESELSRERDLALAA